MQLQTYILFWEYNVLFWTASFLTASLLHISRMVSCSDSDSPVHKKRRILSSKDSDSDVFLSMEQPL